MTAEPVFYGARRFDLRGEAATVARFRRLGPMGSEVGVPLPPVGRDLV